MENKNFGYDLNPLEKELGLEKPKLIMVLDSTKEELERYDLILGNYLDSKGNLLRDSIIYSDGSLNKKNLRYIKEIDNELSKLENSISKSNISNKISLIKWYLYEAIESDMRSG